MAPSYRDRSTSHTWYDYYSRKMSSKKTSEVGLANAKPVGHFDDRTALSKGNADRLLTFCEQNGEGTFLIFRNSGGQIAIFHQPVVALLESAFHLIGVVGLRRTAPILGVDYRSLTRGATFARLTRGRTEPRVPTADQFATITSATEFTNLVGTGATISSYFANRPCYQALHPQFLQLIPTQDEWDPADLATSLILGALILSQEDDSSVSSDSVSVDLRTLRELLPVVTFLWACSQNLMRSISTSTPVFDAATSAKCRENLLKVTADFRNHNEDSSGTNSDQSGQLRRHGDSSSIRSSTSSSRTKKFPKKRRRHTPKSTRRLYKNHISPSPDGTRRPKQKRPMPRRNSVDDTSSDTSRGRGRERQRKIHRRRRHRSRSTSSSSNPHPPGGYWSNEYSSDSRQGNRHRHRRHWDSDNTTDSDRSAIQRPSSGAIKDRLTPKQRKLFNLLSAQNWDDTAPRPNRLARSVLKQKQSSIALRMLRDHTGSWDGQFSKNGFVQVLTEGFTSVDGSYEPTGFSLFHCGPIRYEQRGSSQQDREEQIRQLCGKDGMSEAQIRELAKTDYFLPTTVADIETVLKTGIQALELLTRRRSIATDGFVRGLWWIKSCRRNLNNILHDDPSFGPKFIHLLDQTFDSFCQRLYQFGSIDGAPRKLRHYMVDTIDSDLRDLDRNRVPDIRLPLVLQTYKNSNSHRGKRDKGRTTESLEQGRQMDPSWWSKNPSIEADWGIPTGKKYSDYFGGERRDNLKDWPLLKHHKTGRKRPICIKYQSTGSCYNDCPNTHVARKDMSSEDIATVNSKFQAIYT